MLWFKAFHLIFIVTWFSGLFYLPRLYVYHSMSSDPTSIARFKIMERKLYYGITMPSGVLATLFGVIVLSYAFSAYMQMPWMHLKLALVVLLWIYHIVCGKYLHDFLNDRNKHSSTYYRFFNEVPVVFLVGIIILVVVKPFLPF